jgi:hypothetical protein
MDHLEQAIESNAFVRYLGILCLGLGALFASLTATLTSPGRLEPRIGP